MTHPPSPKVVSGQWVPGLGEVPKKVKSSKKPGEALDE